MTTPLAIETHGYIRCRARNRLGSPCSAYPIRGGTVCVAHGGAAPQVKKAAELRIRALVDPAIDRLAYLIDHGDTDAVRLAACRDVLDRAGYGARHQLELTIRQRAERLAADFGVDVDELILEAQRIVEQA